MRNLQIVVNNEIVDIDEETAFGVSFKGFSFSEADKIHLSASNEFSIPITKKNRKVFGFPDNMSLNSIVANNAYYDKLNIKVFIDGQFLFSGKCYIDSIEESRISIYCVGGKNFIEGLSEMTLKDVTDLVVAKINDELDIAYPSGATFPNIVSFCASGSNSIWLPYAIGTLSKQFPYDSVSGSVHSLVNRYETDSQYNLEDARNIVTEFVDSNVVVGNYKSGHFFVNLKFVLDVLMNYLNFTATYDNRLTTELTADFLKMSDIVTIEDPITGYYSFASNSTYKCKTDDKEGKAFSAKIKAIDFFKTLIQEYAIVFDVDNSNNVSFKCFDEIKTNALKTFKINKITNRKFSLDNIQQTCWIGYSSLNGDGSDAATTGGVKLVCNNKNIEVGSEDTITFSIKRMLVGLFTYTYSGNETKALDLTSSKSMEEIIIARQSNTSTSYTVNVRRYVNGSSTSTGANLKSAIQSTISTNGVYDLYKANVAYPEEIEFDALLKPHEALNFSASNYCRLDGIPGYWYVETIENYNPRIESQIVKMKAMRIR